MLPRSPDRAETPQERPGSAPGGVPISDLDLKLCRCGARIPRVGPGSCQPCEAKRHRDVDSRSTRERGFYSSAQWKRCRAIQLRADPLCADCLTKGKTTPADTVDHVIELSRGGARFDPENLRSLCAPCHNAKTRRYQNRLRDQKRRRDRERLDALNSLRSPQPKG